MYPVGNLEVYLSLLSCSYFFFFSSRRRHTRCLSDWSSDVCSSDLAQDLEDVSRKPVIIEHLTKPCRTKCHDHSPARLAHERLIKRDLIRLGKCSRAARKSNKDRIEALIRSEERRVGKECRDRWKKR